MNIDIKPVAKAVTALVAPFVLKGVAELARWVGIDAPDPSVIDVAISAVVTSVLVWLFPNTPKEG